MTSPERLLCNAVLSFIMTACYLTPYSQTSSVAMVSFVLELYPLPLMDLCSYATVLRLRGLLIWGLGESSEEIVNGSGDGRFPFGGRRSGVFVHS